MRIASRDQLRLGSRLSGVHRASSDDLYDAGSKPERSRSKMLGVVAAIGSLGTLIVPLAAD
jgi:hypothetical protein